MGIGNAESEYNKQANIRLCNVSGHMTELLEFQAPNPKFHVLFIPGNPGILAFYKDFVESLYKLLGGNASVTAIGHISQTIKDWEQGRLFSLQEQIDHKIDFISHELQSDKAPVILVGHSIGSYISIEIFKRASHKIVYCIGLYPFLTQNTKSLEQTLTKKLTGSPILCSLFCSIVALLGSMPSLSRFIVKNTLGRSWSATAVNAACSHLVKIIPLAQVTFILGLGYHSVFLALTISYWILQYHTIRNMMFMKMTEFPKFLEAPDWEFLRSKQGQIAFLFGKDDHWGPLSLFDGISKQAPDLSLSIEKEGHDHAFSCTEAGSLCVAQHVASLINKYSST